MRGDRRIYEGLRMHFNLDDLSKCSLIAASSYKSEGHHSYFSKEFLDHCLGIIILETCFPLTRLPDGPSENPMFSNKNHSYEYSVFYYVEKQYGFQRQSILNNAEDILLTLLCMFTRQFPEDRYVREFSEDLVAFAFISLAEYHGKLFESYVKWSVHLSFKHMFLWNENQLPYRWHKWSSALTDAESLSAEGTMLMLEIVLYRAIWGEMSCGRHLPECMNFLFRWAIEGWNDDIPDDSKFLDSVTALMQRVRDEQWIGIKRKIMIDQKDRLHYDDINELFWTKESVKWLENLIKRSRANNTPLLMRISPKNVGDLINHLAKSDEALKGKKTFTEIRSYLFVFLTFYRVIYFHVIWFPITWTIYKYLHGGETYVYETMITVAPACLRLIKTGVDILVSGWGGQLFCHRNKQSWSFTRYVQTFWNIVVTLYIFIFYFIYGTTGACFRFSRVHSVLVAWPALLLYVIKEGHFLLFSRVSHRRGKVSSKSGTGGSILRFLTFWNTDWRFAGKKANLGLPIQEVLLYHFLWLLIWAIKLVYWIFMMCPIINESISYLNMVSLRPFYVINVAAINDLGTSMFWLGVWIPTFTMFFYDTQVRCMSE